MKKLPKENVQKRDKMRENMEKVKNQKRQKKLLKKCENLKKKSIEGIVDEKVLIKERSTKI